MKTKNVAMLVRKDLRMSVWVVVAGVIIWSMPMWFAYLGMWYFRDDMVTTSLLRMIGMGASVSVMLSVVVMALIVSHILTAERMDRSAAFLAYMPFSRLEALVSKVICALVLTAVFVGLDILLIKFIPKGIHYHHNYTAFLVMFGSVGVLVFGGTWLAGACLKNGAIATVIGVGLPFILWIYIGTSVAGRKMSDEDATWLFMTVAIWMGVFFFLAGLSAFMRRRPEV
jgi:ABC-type transport system involved in multi-copper enzyme maturation permease subunit